MRIKKWFEILLPVVEKEFGSLPQPLYVRPGRAHTRHSGLPWGFYTDPDKENFFIKYHIKNIRGKTENDFYRNGLLFQALHEIAHFYEHPALHERLGLAYQAVAEEYALDVKHPITKYWHWVEGSVELAAHHISLILLRDKEHFEKIQQELGFLGLDISYNDFRRYTYNAMAHYLAILIRSCKLDQVDIQKMDLPFEFSKEEVQKINSFAEIHAKKSRVSNLNYSIPYALGLMRCGIIVARGDMTISELLRTPINNRKLRELTK